MIHSLDENTPTKIDSKKIVVRQKDVYKSSLNCQRKEEFLGMTPDSEGKYLVSGKAVWKGGNVPNSKVWEMYDSVIFRPDGSTSKSVWVEYESEDNSEPENESIYNKNANLLEVKLENFYLLTNNLSTRNEHSEYYESSTVGDYPNTSTPEKENDVNHAHENEYLDNDIEEDLLRPSSINRTKLPMVGNMVLCSIFYRRKIKRKLVSARQIFAGDILILMKRMTILGKR